MSNVKFLLSLVISSANNTVLMPFGRLELWMSVKLGAHYPWTRPLNVGIKNYTRVHVPCCVRCSVQLWHNPLATNNFTHKITAAAILIETGRIMGTLKVAMLSCGKNWLDILNRPRYMAFYPNFKMEAGQPAKATWWPTCIYGNLIWCRK